MNCTWALIIDGYDIPLFQFGNQVVFGCNPRDDLIGMKNVVIHTPQSYDSVNVQPLAEGTQLIYKLIPSEMGLVSSE